MWCKDLRSEEEIYSEIAKSMIDKFSAELPNLPSSATNFIADEIFKAKFDSDSATHCFFSPSKSNGWVPCPAYLDRSKQWEGTKEPAIRGTIVHHFLSRAIYYLKSGVYLREFDWITAIVFQNPDWLSEPGISSVIALLKRIIELGTDNVESEVFLMSPNLGIPNKNLRFGGSIDVLHIKECESPSGTTYADVHIYDLKTGKNPVSPNCWQLKCYALLVRDWLLETRPHLGYCEFTLGIAQDGRILEHDFSNVQTQREAYIQICRAMFVYETVYLENRLNVEINDEVDSDPEFKMCFSPCSYCRFCRGCYKRGEL